MFVSLFGWRPGPVHRFTPKATQTKPYRTIGFGVDVCAPGYSVYSAYSFAGSGSAPNTCYIVGMAGTSMATP